MQSKSNNINVKRIVGVEMYRKPLCSCFYSVKEYKKNIKSKVERARIKRYIEKEFIDM